MVVMNDNGSGKITDEIKIMINVIMITVIRNIRMNVRK